MKVYKSNDLPGCGYFGLYENMFTRSPIFEIPIVICFRNQ